MEQNTNITEHERKIPPVVWLLGVGLLAAVIAILVFNVAVNTVVYYGFFALMMGSHFFMHGSHGGHGGPVGHQHGATSNNADTNKHEHSGHSGGCH